MVKLKSAVSVELVAVEVGVGSVVGTELVAIEFGVDWLVSDGLVVSVVVGGSVLAGLATVVDRAGSVAAGMLVADVVRGLVVVPEDGFWLINYCLCASPQGCCSSCFWIQMS